MTRSIDIAWFECNKCGHRCTPPAAINAIPHQMEVYSRAQITYDPITNLPVIPQIPDEVVTKTSFETAHQGNTLTFKTEGDERIGRIIRSYANATFDKTTLEDSNHITLACPQCGATLYEVVWK